MSRVFLVTPVPEGSDLRPAEAYGTLIRVNRRYLNADELDGDKLPRFFQQQLQQAAEQFNPETDYLLLGQVDHLQMVAFAAMLAIEHGRFRVLRWDRRERAYYPALVSP